MLYPVLMRSAYDQEACSEAFQKMLREDISERNIEEVIKKSLPVLGRVLTTPRFRKYRPGSAEYDDFVSSVVVRFYQHLSSPLFRVNYYHGESTLFSFLFAIFRFEALNAVKKFKREDTRSIDDTRYVPLSLSSSPGYSENQTVLEDLEKMVLIKFKETVSFEDPTDETMCVYLALAIIRGKSIPKSMLTSMGLMKIWGKREKFLLEHTRVLLKTILVNMRSDVMDVTSVDDLHDPSSLIFYEVHITGNLAMVGT